MRHTDRAIRGKVGENETDRGGDYVTWTWNLPCNKTPKGAELTAPVQRGRMKNKNLTKTCSTDPAPASSPTWGLRQ